MRTNASRTRLGLVALAGGRRDADGRGGRQRPEVLSRRSDLTDRRRRGRVGRAAAGDRSGVRHAREPVLVAGDQTPNVRAQNLNTIDEVPDSNVVHEPAGD